MIAKGAKCHTIRANRHGHAVPGDMLRVYNGMRSKKCSKFFPDPPCLWVAPIRLLFDGDGLIGSIPNDVTPINDIDGFALADGFDSISDMSGFWTLKHG